MILWTVCSGSSDSRTESPSRALGPRVTGGLPSRSEHHQPLDAERVGRHPRGRPPYCSWLPSGARAPGRRQRVGSDLMRATSIPSIARMWSNHRAARPRVRTGSSRPSNHHFCRAGRSRAADGSGVMSRPSSLAQTKAAASLPCRNARHQRTQNHRTAPDASLGAPHPCPPMAGGPRLSRDVSLPRDLFKGHHVFEPILWQGSYQKWSMERVEHQSSIRRQLGLSTDAAGFRPRSAGPPSQWSTSSGASMRRRTRGRSAHGN